MSLFHSFMFIKKKTNFDFKHLNRLWKNNLGSKGVSMVFNTLSKCKGNLTSINIFKNNQDDDFFPSLANFLNIKKEINVLFLGGSKKITDSGLKLFSELIAQDSSVNMLYFDACPGVTDKSVPFLIKIIQTLNVEEIGVNKTSISDKERLKLYTEISRMRHGKDAIYICDL